MKKLILTLCLAVILAGGWALRAPADAPGLAFRQAEAVLHGKTETHRLRVELAETPAQWQQGLMHRTALAGDAGMLFIFDEPREMAMWMKNTRIPLDMAFIAEGGAITHIEKNTVPESTTLIPSGGKVAMVLEVNAGTLDALKIGLGDRITYDAPAP